MTFTRMITTAIMATTPFAVATWLFCSLGFFYSVFIFIPFNIFTWQKMLHYGED